MNINIIIYCLNNKEFRNSIPFLNKKQISSFFKQTIYFTLLVYFIVNCRVLSTHSLDIQCLYIHGARHFVTGI